MVAENYDRVEVGRRIKRLRQARDLTVHALAKRAKMSAGYVSEVERGLPAVSLDKLMQIAEALEVEVDSLIGKSSDQISSAEGVRIPEALSEAAENLNLSYRATLTLLRGKLSLTAKRSQDGDKEWTAEDWIQFYHQVKDYLPEC